MLWSSTTLPGRPTVLMVDASLNRQGWESEYCRRLFNAFQRRGLRVLGDAPLPSRCPEDLLRLRSDEAYNSILLFAQGIADQTSPEGRLRSYWDWLASRDDWPNILLAACSWEDYDPETTQQIVNAPKTIAAMAVVQGSPLTPREASLFFLKFFTELGLHSTDSITGRMVWFSCSKARELLRRRRLPGQFEVRC
jgi:hypothetical protein